MIIIILFAIMQAHIIIIAGSGHTGSIRDGRTIRLTFRENRETEKKSKKRQNDNNFVIRHIEPNKNAALSR